MKIIGVIPARWGSTRFEGKPLADIAGKPMVRHVWERSKKSRLLDDVLIACDDERVAAAAKKFGATAIMTSPHHASGTDRIAEAIAKYPADIIVNIQGDEPLMDSRLIDHLAQALVDKPQCVMATVIKKIERTDDLDNPNVVKVVKDHDGIALYFSRSAIPFDRDGKGGSTFYKHIGIYAYRRDFLLMYKNLPASKLEQTEKLEQLRALEAGFRIMTVETDRETIGVDTPEDVAKVTRHRTQGTRHMSHV
jgi:3-deoxy-manno-octulosonate cytidylyltransferase (CMP-KDO synthetase)